MNSIILLGMPGMGEWLVLLIMPAIFAGIFIALRTFFLWYWKINTLINNQQEQIQLLREILSAQKKNDSLKS